MGKIYCDNPNPKKDRVTILIPKKIDFKRKYIIRDKKDQFITMKLSILQDSIAVLRVSAPSR